MMKKSRAEKAGEDLGKSIIEMTNLMYQRGTQDNFFKGLKKVIDDKKGA